AIFATGTRGAWIAAAGVVGLALVLKAWNSRSAKGATPTGEEEVSGNFPPRGSRALVGGIALVVVIGGAAALTPAVRGRFGRGWKEVESALRSGDYMSDTGKRLLMWRGAVEAVAARPLRGVGAGGYHRWAADHLRARGFERAEEAVHAHAHSAFLHIAA